MALVQLPPVNILQERKSGPVASAGYSERTRCRNGGRGAGSPACFRTLPPPTHTHTDTVHTWYPGHTSK